MVLRGTSGRLNYEARGDRNPAAEIDQCNGYIIYNARVETHEVADHLSAFTTDFLGFEIPIIDMRDGPVEFTVEWEVKGDAVRSTTSDKELDVKAENELLERVKSRYGEEIEYTVQPIAEPAGLYPIAKFAVNTLLVAIQIYLHLKEQEETENVNINSIEWDIIINNYNKTVIQKDPETDEIIDEIEMDTED